MSSSLSVSSSSVISPTAADVLEGDGMTTNMITAARLLGHKSVNGRYQTTMQLDKFPVLGHQMTHSIDSCTYTSTRGARSRLRAILSGVIASKSWQEADTVKTSRTQPTLPQRCTRATRVQ